ncbi:ankyrin repeat domain-containing protein 13b [Phtheirospermum japonicum]|uniref:Ankyrin repeat domain-containing protein 13b n=1 Tax=Phtheirospermum japonicum TaxID=374723 RepID=A0A830C3W8_9LAMI|nr:ankyrin repeat domain-containing protein 13b [Phtheirospermum japonicum]
MKTTIVESKYAHSPVHKAVISKDYAALRRIISSLPRFCNPSEIHTESVSSVEEAKADAIAAAIDRRDVPNRDTPLHLAVKSSDEIAAEILMLAGADWSLQNAHGWSPLQEAICNREEKIAKIIVRHCQPLAWAKWCRRLPRLIGTMRRMRDFYMEITFHFESSVIPFISKIAPSDTYKIWKRGANLRADTSLAGFDGLKIQRADQSFLFLGDGSEDGKVLPGSLCVVSHKDKDVLNAMDGAGTPATEAEAEQEVSSMSRTNIFRPGIDVTQAVLLLQTTWRKQEKTEMVGPWKAKVYDMHNVVVSIRSRMVPGVAMEDELLDSCNENETESEVDDILTKEERNQLESVLKTHSSEEINENGETIIAHRHSCYERRDIIPVKKVEEKKGWFNGRTRMENDKKIAPPRSSLCVEDNVGNLLEDSPSRSRNKTGRHSIEVDVKLQRGNAESGNHRKNKNHENEYKKSLRPTLCLSQHFPLQTEELLPLLDILANKVKAIRRLRELLTTKLPKGTFPVKVAIPVVPTIRVIVTFTKFEELQPLNEFSTPPSSPSAVERNRSLSSSWFQWVKSPYQRPNSSTSGSGNRIENIQDPFAIPSDYKWVTAEEKKKKMQSVKAKARN